LKKKSALPSSFVNARILIGLLVGLVGVFLALADLGAFLEPVATVAQARQKDQTFNHGSDPLVPPLFDCSKIHELGIDKQANLRAGTIMIFCGEAQGGSASPADKFSRFFQQLLPSTLAYGTMDISLITGMEMFPHITQSTTFSAGNPDNPLQIIVAYIDTRGRNADPINLGGAHQCPPMVAARFSVS
jgi:hypothetical protein